MKQWKSLICLLLCVVVLGGCGAAPEPAQATVPIPGDGYFDIGVDQLPYSDEELYSQLFDLNNKISIQIDMPDSELQKLQDDYEYYNSFSSKSPIYRMGTMIITIQTAAGTASYRMEEVGVRMKGNTSRTDFYNAGEGIYKYIHLKLDFQETFDDEDDYGTDVKAWDNEDLRDQRKDRTFAGLESLEMRWNKCYDQTYLKETYAYELYRSEGVMAPLTNLCSFDWSGVHMGIYCIVEPVDKLFLEKRLPKEEQGGDLYKCSWPASFTSLDSIGVENEKKGEFYVYDLKTNKKTSDHSALKNWLTALNYSTMTKEALGELVEMDEFLGYAAVSYFLGNPDDLRNNYNNFYLYLKPSGKAVIIPYDLDRCLGITYEWDPTGNAVTQINPFTEEMAAVDGIGAHGQRNPLYLYSVVRGGFYVQEYADVLRRVEQNELLNPETFERYFTRSSSLYAGEEIPSKTLYNAHDRYFPFTLEDGIGGNLSFGNYIKEKKEYFEDCMSKLPEYLAYVQPEKAHCYIRGQFNGWSDHPDYAMKLENGVLSITLTVEENGEFKVYDHLNSRWYGPENMSPDTTAVYYSVGEHNNIYLTRGTYHITFDPLTQQITITYA